MVDADWLRTRLLVPEYGDERDKRGMRRWRGVHFVDAGYVVVWDAESGRATAYGEDKYGLVEYLQGEVEYQVVGRVESDPRYPPISPAPTIVVGRIATGSDFLSAVHYWAIDNDMDYESVEGYLLDQALDKVLPGFRLPRPGSQEHP